MSSFELSDNSIALMSEFIYLQAINVDNRNVIGFGGDSLNNFLCKEFRENFNDWHTLNEKDVFILLKKLNIDAVTGRHNSIFDDKWDEFDIDFLEIPKIDDFPEIDFFKVKKSNNGMCFKVATAQHWQILKTFECFIYQCEEDATRNSKLLKMVKDLKNTLMEFLIQNQSEYVNAIWG